MSKQEFQHPLLASSEPVPQLGAAAEARAPSRARILIADDEPVARLTLLGALRDHYDVEMAVDGRDALQKFAANRPDLMIVDVNMPELSGCEVCAQVRASETDQRTPILLISAENDESVVVDGLARGADDFVVKPYNQRVLLSKVRSRLQTKYARDAVAHQREQLMELLRATTHEHFLAQGVLKNILGRAELNHPSIRCMMTGATGFEGDVALVAKLPQGGLRVMVSDVVGHGLPAALGTIPIALLFYSITRRGTPLEDAMCELCNELHGVLPSGSFAAAAAFEVNAANTTLRVWNGGIPDVLLRRQRSGEVVHFGSLNLPIGVVRVETAVVEDASVEAGDVVFAMSDGVTETSNAEGELFGTERVAEVLARDVPLDTLYNLLCKTLFAFGRGQQQDDDITLLQHTVGL